MNPNYQLLSQRKFTKQNIQVADRLHVLVNSLQNANKGFKHIAERCSNRKTQIVVFGLATESFQIYKELSSQMQVFEGKPAAINSLNNEYKSDVADGGEPKHDDSNKILDECTQIEKNLITEFRKLLNDSIIAGDLRKLLQEQLNAFLYAFVKLKMLRNYNSSTIDYGIIF